jgi:cytidylate kinase
MAVVTISRLYGSGGDEVAAQVCEHTGYRYLDKQLMASIASEVALAEVQLSDIAEGTYKGRNLLDRLLRPSSRLSAGEIRAWTSDTRGARSSRIEKLDEQAAVELVSATLQAVYRRGDIVILGRGGQMVLRDQPGVLHVRIEAPLETRVRRVQAQEGLSQPEARQKALESDRAAANYLKRFYGVDWVDPLLYHLVINTGWCELASATRLVCTALKDLTPVEPASAAAA